MNDTEQQKLLEMKKELEEFGFEEDHIEIATKFSNNKEEVINIIVKMIEEPSFYIQMKEGVEMIKPSSTSIDSYKMVILVRDDLKMGIGKIAAQVGHAVLAAYKKCLIEQPEVVKLWEEYSGSRKIVLSVESEKELLEFAGKGKDSNLNSIIIRDAGRTQVEPGTMTCCAIGPGRVPEIDSVTGKLRLL